VHTRTFLRTAEWRGHQEIALESQLTKKVKYRFKREEAGENRL